MRHYRHAYADSQTTLVSEAAYGQRGLLSATNHGLFDVRKLSFKAIKVRWIKNLAVIGLGSARPAQAPVFHMTPCVRYSSISAAKIGSVVGTKQDDKFGEVVTRLALCRTGGKGLRLVSTWTGEHERDFSRISDFEMDCVL